MTSRHLFFRVMREDLRHKVWMIALSVLCSFLGVAMVWLMGWGNERRFLSGIEGQEKVVLGRTLDFFMEYLPVLGALTALVMALATGLLGFDYLFHKNRVDTYASLPIKRSTLFAAVYLDGILIWLMPFLTCLSVPLVMGTGYAGRIGGVAAAAEIFKLVWQGLLVQVTAFLLVYNLVLIAVMLSGNVLNALVSMVFLGFGVVGVHGMVLGFFSHYMDHFYMADEGAINFTSYLSPLFSALNFVVAAADSPGGRFGEVAWLLCGNLGMALLLGLCAWILCKRRASELAEQGIRSGVITAVMQLAAGVTAGMCGWILLTSMASYGRSVWGCFGAVFAGVVVCGVMDVIFQMDFKAFFAHKLRIAVVTAVSLAVCFAFEYDWFGYDTYLPGKEEIAEAAVYDREFSSSFADRTAAERWALEEMHCTDVDAVYRFLEYGTGRIPFEPEVTDAGKNYEEVAVKVTLKNGKDYYRSYRVPADEELLWPVYTSEEYLRCAYLIDEEAVDRMAGMTLRRENDGITVESAAAARSVAQAFNRDVEEHSLRVLAGEGVFLTRLILHMAGSQAAYELNIYSAMEHSIEALRQAGYGAWVETCKASEVDAIELPLWNVSRNAEPEEVLAMAGKVYGVQVSPGQEAAGGEEMSPGQEAAGGEEMSPGQEAAGGEEASPGQEAAGGGEAFSGEEAAGDEAVPPGMSVIDAVWWDGAVGENEDTIVVKITDRAEIEEILGHISYMSYNSNNYIRKNYTAVTLIGADGSERECYLQQGCLPQRYLSRFAEVFRTYRR